MCYFRRTDDVLRALLASPKFRGHQTYTPFRITFGETADFIYTTPMSGDRVWAHQACGDYPRCIADANVRAQSTLPAGDLSIPILFATDKTALTIATGSATMQPLYMCCAINDAHVCRGPHGAMPVVAYIPVLKRASRRLCVPTCR